MTKFNHMSDIKVEVQVPTAGLQNLVKNSTGALGAWGWETPVAGTSMQGYDGTPPALNFYGASTSIASNFRTEFVPIVAGKYAIARFDLLSITASHSLRVRFEWYNSSKVLLSSSTQTAGLTGIQTHYRAAVVAPTNTAYMKVRFDFYNGTGTTNPAANAAVEITNVMAASSATSTGFGSIRENLFPDPNATRTNAWTATGVLALSSTRLTGATAIKLSNSSSARQELRALSVDAITVTAGGYYTLSAYMRQVTVATAHLPHMGIRWTFADSSYTEVFGGSAPLTTSGWTQVSTIQRAPEGAVSAQAVIKVPVGALEELLFDTILFEKTNMIASFFDGSSTSVGSITYAWSGTANASKSTATIASAGFDYQPPYAWLPITGSINDIDIDTEAMEVGIMAVVIKDKVLDPAGMYDPILKVGKYIRISIDYGYIWEPLFTGKIKNAHVDYDKTKKAYAPVETTISINATDAMTDLANQGETRSVASISDLPYILEGKGVPWFINGARGQVATTPVVPVVSDNLSVADQVVLTRDTNQGQAFVDGRGVLNVDDYSAYDGFYNAYFTDTVRSSPTGDSDAFYQDIDIDWDTERVINHVVIKHLVTNAEGNPEEIIYGPYEDAASVDLYGAKKAEYTVVGTSVVPATYASSVLSRNATPQVRVNSVRVKVKTREQMYTSVYQLCQFALVVFDGKEYVGRIQTINHEIGIDGWFITYTFSSATSTAVPQYTPSPTPPDTLTNTGWIAVTFTPGTGWTNYGSPFQTVQYRRRDGIVYLRGLAAGGTTATSAIFTLPTGFRPSATRVFTVHGNLGARRLDVQVDGVVLQPEGGNTGFSSMDGVYFDV